MIEQKVAREVAEQEFYRFAELMAIDIDTSKLEVEDKINFDKQFERFVRAVMNGSLVVNENGEPEFTPVRSDDKSKITFYEPTGRVIQAMDKQAERHNVAKLYDALAAMTRCSNSRFAAMKLADLHVCEAIFVFFLTA